MWILYAIVSMFLMALVNYSDEYLTHSSTTDKDKNIHHRIGGVLIMSTLMCFVGITVVGFMSENLILETNDLILVLLTSIIMVSMWASYFYLMQNFSAHQVVPLFGLSSIWLLVIEISAGASIMPLAIAGIFILIVGAYLLDNPTLKIRVPSKLLLFMIPTSFAWSVIVYIIKILSLQNDVTAIYFWQSVGILIIGISLFLIVKSYRVGFMGRVKLEKNKFILPSLFNESCSQLSFLLSSFAVSLAPFAVYYTAISGIQSIFLLLIFSLFPLNDRNKVFFAQWVGILLIAIGVGMLDIWKS